MALLPPPRRRTLKGADESSAKDMGVFADNCTELGEAFGCLAIAVHHNTTERLKCGCVLIRLGNKAMAQTEGAAAA